MKRLISLIRRTPSTINHDVDAELQFHIDARTDALVREGLTRDDARFRALH